MLPRIFSNEVYDYLRSVPGVKTGDIDSYFAGKTDLKNVLSKEELEKLREIRFLLTHELGE